MSSNLHFLYVAFLVRIAHAGLAQTVAAQGRRHGEAKAAPLKATGGKGLAPANIFRAIEGPLSSNPVNEDNVSLRIWHFNFVSKHLQLGYRSFVD